MIIENMKKSDLDWGKCVGVCRALFIDQSMANMKVAWNVCDPTNK